MADLTGMLQAAAGRSVPTQETDPNFNQTVLLLHGDGTNGQQNNTFLDSSTNNFTITRNGNTTQGTFSPFSAPDGRWSAFINNADSYVSYGSNADFTFGTGDFTVEAWVYVSSIGASQYFNIFNVGGESTGSYSLYVFANGTIQSVRYGDSAGSGTTTGTINFNAWNHIAAVRSGGTAVVYINGVADANSSYSMGNISASAGETGRLWQTAYTASGYVSNLRVCKGTAVYSSGFTPSTEPLTSTSQSASNCKLLTLQSNRFVDTNTATTAKTITISGSPKVTPFSPFAPTAAYDASVNGGSGYFDGTGDYLTIPSDTAFNFGTGAFSVEFWVYITSLAENPSLINTNSTSIFYEVGGSNRGLCLFASSAAQLTSATTVLPIGAWSHVVVCRDSSGNLSSFVNGIRLDTDASNTSTVDFSGAIINRYFPSAAGHLFGYTSSLRLIKGSTPYDPTSTTITVPTAPPTNITNTSLLCNFTNAGIFDNTGKNNLETVGNAQIDTTTKKFGTGSMEFDGTGDYLQIPTQQNFVFGTGDFTVEFWVYANALSGYQNLFDGRAVDGTLFPLLWFNNTSIEFYANGSVRASSTVTTSTWYHIALSRSGTSTKLFVDGTQAGSTYTDSNNYTADSFLYISRYGPSATNYLNGYIDDLRITKGVARYTTTFSVPTKAFPDL